jgi:ribosomal-protein-alanine N-acetyltransferase
VPSTTSVPAAPPHGVGALHIEPLAGCPADIEACRAIDAEGFRHSGWNVAEELSRPHTRIWVAKRNAALVGYLAAWHVADELQVLSVAVAGGARRGGAGRALVAATRAYAAAHGARGIFLDVRRSNDAARALYHATGFVELGTRRGYYADTSEDAIELGLFFGLHGEIDRSPR